MASVTATINVQINAANAAAQLTALQGKVAAMNKGMLAATASGVMAQEKAIRRMGNVLSGSGMFTTGIRNVHTELGRMHQEFDRGSTTLQKYRQNSRVWGKDHSAINRMAADRVRMLQSQYVALGREMNGVQQAMQIKPDRMMREFGADAEYAHQKAVLFRRNLQMGSTALVNWGKNTQWAGRQMMVGMGIPIAIMATGAIKAFNDIEKSSIAFKRVYGDTTTSVAEKSQMLAKMQSTVGKEMMKYGIAMSDTLDVSAKAAATGAQGADLIAATRETMRLATLGNMDYNKALEATIAMQTAFNINSKDMAKTTDFLNAVENQTILSMEDMALAVPRVAPVIKGLGGNVEDLAIMMTALRQGGVSAEQGANALKSGLGSLLNPTGTAIEQFDGLGINLKKIVDTNKGDLIGTIQGLGKALDGLTKYDRQRALESLFGKYQYARMGALLKNINSKAVRETMKMAKASPGELAKMSEAELGQIADSPMIKLRKSIEELKAAAAPLGALFSDIGAKIISFATPVVDFFAKNDAAKWGLAATAGFAALAGVVTMVVGVFANFAGSMVKAGMAVKTFFRFITGQRSLAYVTTDELQAAAAANSLATAADRAAGGMMAEAKAAQLLTSQLEALIAAQNGAAATSRRPGPGTTGVPAAPKPSGPIVPAPSATTASFTQAQKVAMLTREGTTVRSHVGQPMVFNKQQLAAIEKYHEAGVAKGQKSAIAFTEAARAGTLRGYSSIALGWGANTNMELSDSAKSLGVEKSRLLAQLQMRPGEVMAPFLDDLARNSGITTEQVMSDPRVQSWANDTVNKLHSGIAQSAVQTFKDSDVERIAAPILSSIKDVSPEYAKGYSRMLLPEQYGVPGQSRVSLQQGVVDKLPGQFAAVRPKTVKTGDAVALSNTHLANLRIGPGEEVTPNGLVVPKGTMDEQRQTANEVAKTQKQTPTTRTGNNMPGLFNSWDKKKPAPTPKQPVMQRRQFTGMGLMGVGMLAQTAMMGMEMAGKEVPQAAQFAATGLMGVGMAAMSFPKAAQKVGDAFSNVIGVMPPVVKAIAGIGLVVASSALIWKTLNQKWRRDGVNLGKAVTDTTQGLEETGQIFGKTGYVDKQIAKDQKTSDKSMTTGEEFLKSDVGKQWLDEYANVASKAGVATATGSFASKLATAVVNGVMGTSDVKGVFAALTKENAVMASSVKADFLKLVGGSMKNIDPFAASLAVNRQNKIQSDALLSASQQRIEQAKQASSTQWSASGYGTTTGAVAGRTMQQGVNIRALMQENAGIAAGAWSGTIATAFQNRLAAEAQLAQMIEARDRLANKKDRTGDETKQMNRLTSQINNGTEAIGKMDNQVHKTMDGIEALYNAEGTDRGAMERSIFESLGQNDNKMVRLAAAMLDGAAIGDQRVKFTMAVALESGMLQPEALMNMFNQFGSPDAAATTLELGINTIGTAPAMDFFNALATVSSGKQTAALRTFGNEFTTIANKAKLSAKEAGALAKALGASPKQVKDVKVNIKKGKVEDPGKDIKSNRTVNVKGNTKDAKRELQDVGKEADKVGKKKASVKARVDGATKGVNDLKKLGKTADDADKKKVKIDADTSRAEAKAKQVEATLSKGNPPPIPITAQDKTTAVIAAVQAQIVAMQAIAAVPMIITAINNASPTLTTIIGQLNSIQSKTVTVTVNKVENDAIGGLVGRYATGGIYTGNGKVTGPGGPTDDKVNARLSDGEYVIRASSVDKYGAAFLDAVNRGAYEKQAYAKGTPFGKTKTPNAPKDKEGKGRQVAFMNEWRNVMYEADNFVKEFNKMEKIIKHGRGVLGKRFKDMDYEFGRWIMDNYSPRQIKKMFRGKEKGAKQFAKQYRAEQKLAYRDEVRQQNLTVRNAKLKNQLLLERGMFGKDGAGANAVAGMSDDQLQMYSRLKGKKKTAFVDNIIQGARIQEQQTKMTEALSRKKDIAKQYSGATGATLLNVSNNQGMSMAEMQQAADALGVSIDDVAQQIEDGDLPTNFKQLAEKAKLASKAMEVLSMTQADRNAQLISNRQSMMSTYQDVAGARARAGIQGKYGKSQSVLEAEAAVSDAQNAIDQARIDDINEKYSKQLEIFDQISQQQQAIANLERGRLSVANALSTGDIAAAAMAAQQQRSETASFMQSQMRTQLENQQKAQTSALQDQINERMRITRDIQNQIALEIANQNLLVAPMIGDLQSQNDTLMMQPDYITVANQAYEEQNTLLMMNNAELDAYIAKLATAANIPAPNIEASVPVPTATGGSNKNKSNKDKPGKKTKKGKHNAFGGWVPGVGNSDNVPLLATPGEFVMRKAAAARFGPTLQAMNSGSIKEIGGTGGGVSIDNIIFNINGANLDERAVADIAVRKMKSLDSATIKGGRF